MQTDGNEVSVAGGMLRAYRVERNYSMELGGETIRLVSENQYSWTAWVALTGGEVVGSESLTPELALRNLSAVLRRRAADEAATAEALDQALAAAELSPKR